MLPFHAIAVGRRTGIFQADWSDVEPLVKGYPGCKHKKFWSMEEARNYLIREQNKIVSAAPIPIVPPITIVPPIQPMDANHDVVIRPARGGEMTPKGKSMVSNVLAVAMSGCILLGLLHFSFMLLA
jgi:hypothetical protein